MPGTAKIEEPSLTTNVNIFEVTWRMCPQYLSVTEGQVTCHGKCTLYCETPWSV